MQKLWVLASLLAIVFASMVIYADGKLRADALQDQYVYVGDEVYFTGAFSTGDIEGYSWDFGDGCLGQGMTVKHTFQESGDYSVTLAILCNTGEKATASVVVHVMECVDETRPMIVRGYFGGVEMPSSLQDFLDNKNLHDTLYIECFVEDLSRKGFNAIVFSDFHPYPKLTTIPGYSESQSISDEELDYNYDLFSRLLDIAGNHGIRVYIMVTNIEVSPNYAKTYWIPVRNVDIPPIREYTAAAVEAFHEAFPDLGGLIITVGESPVACVDFVREAVFEPLLKMDPQPYVIVRDQGLYPADIAYSAQGIEDWNILSKAVEDQWLGDALSLRGTLHSRATGKRVIYLSWYRFPLFNGGYESIRGFVEEVRSRHGDGIITYIDNDRAHWLYSAAFGFYMSNLNPSENEEESYFGGLVEERFGDSVSVELFLETANVNASIMTTVRRQLFHRQGRSSLHYGLPLVSFIGLPTYSSWVYAGLGETARYEVEDEARFSWWIPREERFTEDYLTVQEFLTGSYQSAAKKIVTPVDTITTLNKMADLTLQNLSQLRSVDITLNIDVWLSNLNDMEFQAYIGKFYAAKLSAAIAWEQWAQGLVSAQEARSKIEMQLAESIAYYSEATEVYERNYGYGAPTEKIEVAGEPYLPPWPHWQTYAGEIYGGMREMLAVLGIELDMTVHRIEEGNRTLVTFAEILSAMSSPQ